MTFQSSAVAPESPDVATGESGFFTWEMATDQLYADGAVAEMFGLDQKATECGLPLETYLQRIHPEDRAGVAAEIQKAINTARPEQQSYRVAQADGDYSYVMVFGRCFRDRNGVPTLYAGIICPVSDEPALTKPLVRYCLTAYEIAVQEGNEAVAQHLLAALTELDWLPPEGVLPN